MNELYTLCCSPRSSITHMCVANNILVMAMSGNILLRNDLEHHPDQPEGGCSVNCQLNTTVYPL